MCTIWLPHSRVDLDGCGGCFLHLPAYAVPTFPHQVGGSLKDSHVSGMWSRTRVVHFDTYTQMHTQTQMYGITPPPLRIQGQSPSLGSELPEARIWCTKSKPRIRVYTATLHHGLHSV